MTIKLAALLTVVSLGAVACSHNSAADLAPGTYKSSTSSTGANGTKVDKDVTTNVAVDPNGDKTVDTTTKTSTDPKGLFNKTTNTTSSQATYSQ